MAFTGVNDAPLARDISVSKQLSLQTVFTFDESWLDITEHDLDAVTGRPEIWSYITITDYRGPDLVRWSGDVPAPDGTSAANSSPRSLSDIFAGGVQELTIPYADLHKLSFAWNDWALTRCSLAGIPISASPIPSPTSMAPPATPRLSHCRSREAPHGLPRARTRCGARRPGDSRGAAWHP